MRNFKQKTLLAAVSALAGLGFCSQASAYTYFGSDLSISGLNIRFFEAGTNNQVFPGVSSFDFNLEASANLNSDPASPDLNLASCLGGGVGTSGAFTTCNSASPRLSVTQAEVGIAPVGDDGSFTRTTPDSGNNYARADTEITTAQPVAAALGQTPEASSARQVAEGEVYDTDAGGALASIGSTSGFSVTFQNDLGFPLDLLVEFDAIADLLVESENPDASFVISRASVAVSFGLDDDQSDASADFAPDGITDNCTGTGGLTCSDTTDDGTLNETISTTTAVSSTPLVTGGAYSALFGNLTDSTYSLSLTFTNDGNVVKIVPVPEPGILTLLGLGLAGLGVTRRRRQAKSA